MSGFVCESVRYRKKHKEVFWKPFVPDTIVIVCIALHLLAFTKDNVPVCIGTTIVFV